MCDDSIAAACVDLVVIGAGPAGLAAAVAAKRHGVEDVLVIERDNVGGGILNQCIHNGFGLHYFGEELTGPEYAERFLDLADANGVRIELNAMVLSLSRHKVVEYISPQSGYRAVQANAVVLAMGCRERTRGQIAIPGTRPAGVLTAGAAQRYVNIEGYMVGKRIIILGSGDIGLIMARRMALEGAEVVAVVELMPYSSGLTRNIVQCLHDFNIPLLLSHTIVNIDGRRRVERVTVAAVDANRRPIPGTEQDYAVDTVLLSVGLIPENELSVSAGIDLDPVTRGPIVNDKMETSLPGVFACGNAVQVHDLVDYVSQEGERAGSGAALYLQNNGASGEVIALSADGEVSYIVPQFVKRASLADNVDVFLRVKRPLEKGGIITFYADGQTVLAYRRKHLNPGEMEHLVLPHQVMSRLTANRLTVRIEDYE